VDCPFDCPHLQDARVHDRPAEIDLENLPNRDITVTEEFLADNEPLVNFLSQTLVSAALATPGAVDFDVREALDGLVRTYRTLESGVYYQSMPANPLAAAIFQAVAQAPDAFREQERQRFGIAKTRDADVLGVLVFLQRIELDRNNGRRRGRAFLDAMRRFQQGPAEAPPPSESRLILP
jgi:hypothetical protein